jgi:hypothetical protein
MNKFLITLFLIFTGWAANSQNIRKIKTIPGGQLGNQEIYNTAYNFVAAVVTDTAKGTIRQYFKKDGTPLPDGIDYDLGYNVEHSTRFVNFSTQLNGEKKMGIADADGKVVVPARFDQIQPVMSLSFTTGQRGNRYYLIYPEENGREVVLPENFDNLPKAVGPDRLVYKKPLYDERYLYKFDGTRLSRGYDFLKYDPAYPDYYLARGRERNERFALYRNHDAVVMTGWERNITLTNEGLILVHYLDERSRIEVFDRDFNKLKTDKILSEYSPEGYIFRKQYANGSTYGMVDKNFNVTVPPVYTNIWNLRNGYLRCKTETNENGLLSWSGETILPAEFQEFFIILSHNDFIAQKNWKQSWYDRNGNLLMDFNFYQRRDHEANMQALVRLEPGFEHKALPLEVEGGVFHLFGRDGRQITESPYENIQPAGDDLFLTTLSGKQGMIDVTGRVILKNEFDQIQPILFKFAETKRPTGLFLLKKGNLTAICNREGKLLLPYDFESYKTVAVSDKYIWIVYGGDWEVYELTD